jgi:hypothetical protein
MPIPFPRISYSKLKSRLQENYNFHKFSAVLADYGFATIRLSDDWCCADFIAQHIDGRFLKIPLKGRLAFAKKYAEKDLWMCFPSNGGWYLYPHDELLLSVLPIAKVKGTYLRFGAYTFSRLSPPLLGLLSPYRLE